MYFAVATVLVTLPLITASASPAFHNVPHTKISLNKRSGLTQADGSVNVANLRSHLAWSTAKVRNGFAAFDRNTGSKHPLDTTSTANKRATGSDPLMDHDDKMWYGSISIGTPPQNFAG